LRVGTNAGGEYRTVEYVEVVEVVVFAIAVDHAAGLVFAHGQPAHAVSGAGGKGIGTEFQRVNASFGFFPVGKPGRIDVRDPHRFGTGGKLDFCHAQPGAAHAIPQVIVDDVVDNRRAIAGQFNAAAFAVRVEAIAQQGNHGVQVGQFLNIRKMLMTVTQQQH